MRGGHREHLKGSSRGDLHRRTCESHIEPPRGGAKHQFHRMQRVKSTSNVQRQRNRNSQSNNRRLNRWQQDSA